MLDRDEVAEAYEKAKQERQRAWRRMHDAQQTIQALARVMEGYAMLYPELKQDEPEESGVQQRLMTRPPASTSLEINNPRGQEAVLEVMKDEAFANRRWTIEEMTEELDRRGWTPKSEQPVNAVRAALNRLARSDDSVRRLRNKERGLVFRYSPGGAGDGATFGKIVEPTIRVSSGAPKGGS
jgi:hypothetical protein